MSLELKVFVITLSISVIVSVFLLFLKLFCAFEIPYEAVFFTVAAHFYVFFNFLAAYTIISGFKK